jgi:hypothetical protein
MSYTTLMVPDMDKQPSWYDVTVRVAKDDDDQPVGAEYSVALCDLGIFVDQAAEPVPPQDPDILAHSGRRLARWAGLGTAS